MHVYHSRWHELSDEHIENLLKKYLAGANHWPYAILPRLRELEVATLEFICEVLDASVFRIRETNELIKTPGFFVSNIWNLEIKPVSFYISSYDDKHLIHRDKPPAFVAEYEPFSKELFNITWKDGEPDQTKLISTVRKAHGWLLKSVK